MMYDNKSVLPAFRTRKYGRLTQEVLYPEVVPLLLPYNGDVAVGYNGGFALQRPSYKCDCKKEENWNKQFSGISVYVQARFVSHEHRYHHLFIQAFTLKTQQLYMYQSKNAC